MTLLSVRAKEAIKTGLAMALAYGIALRMDWDNPHWAAIAVAVISLTTAGQSLNKGAMRMLGTLIGVTIALILLGLFPQARWEMLLALSLYVGFCAYMMTGPKYPYFWLVSGFVCLVICVNAGTSAEQAFYIAVERAQETAMGILVYTLVSVFLWPRHSADELDEVSRKLLVTQAQLFSAYRGLMVGRGSMADSQPLRQQVVQLFNQLGPILDAAESDSYRVFEVRRPWRRLRTLNLAMMEALARWRVSCPEVQHLDLARIMPDVESFGRELEQRFTQIERMLAGERPTLAPRAVNITVEKAALRACSHLETAAVAVTRAELERLEHLTRSLFACVRDIRGFAESSEVSPAETPPRRVFTLDPDRLGGAVTVVANLCIAFLIWIYLDPPGHSGFAQFSATMALVAATMPGVPARSMLRPFAMGCVFAGILYVFVMPHLSSYWELSVMLFLVTTLAYYLFWQPRQGLDKFGAIIPVIVLLSIENQQGYDFARFANSAAMIILGIGLAVLTSYIPHSPRPEKRFLRLRERFFRHSRFLISQLGLDWGEKNVGLLTRWRTRYYCGNLLMLSHKLAIASSMIDCRAFPGNTPERVQSLALSLQQLALRIRVLVDARDYPQADPLVRHLSNDTRQWRSLIQDLFQLWISDPAARPGDELRDKLATWLEGIEDRVRDTLSQVEQGTLKDEDYTHFYRLLGSYRGLSEAMVCHAGAAESINWELWREPRF